MQKFGVFTEVFNYDKEFDILTLRFDGSCEPINPGGDLGWGWALLLNDDIITEGWGYQLADDFNQTSNNLAEWAGMYYGLKHVLDNEILYKQLNVIGDSKLVIRQALGWYSINPGKTYSPIALRFLKEIKPYIKDVSYQWQRRDNNEYCDMLASRYMEVILQQNNEI